MIKNSIFNHFIREIRDVDIQKDSMRFRRNIERIGEVFAYEISKKMEYENTKKCKNESADHWRDGFFDQNVPGAKALDR